MAVNEELTPAKDEKFGFKNFDATKPSFVSIDDKAPEGMKWVKVEKLSDEFNGTFDTDKWVKTFWNYGNTPVFMQEENSGVSNGNLWIKATLNEERGDQWFETSRVRSKNAIRFPMYTECSVKAANISAFTTFWLNNGNSVTRDEIDIIENNPKPSIKENVGEFTILDYPWQMNSQFFIVKDSDEERNKGNFDNRRLSDKNPLKGVKWNEAYHIVGAWWKDENTVQFYLDGEPAGKVTAKEKKFTLKQFIIWDLWTQDTPWVGGEAIKSDLLDNSMNTMKVDWVRTWKLKKE